MKTVKVGMTVAKDSGKSNGYWRGTVTKVKGKKALVHFKTRNLSRWCSIDNLDPVTKR